MSIVVRVGEIQLTVHGISAGLSAFCQVVWISLGGYLLEKLLRELGVNHVEVSLFYG